MSNPLGMPGLWKYAKALNPKSGLRFMGLVTERRTSKKQLVRKEGSYSPVQRRAIPRLKRSAPARAQGLPLNRPTPLHRSVLQQDASMKNPSDCGYNFLKSSQEGVQSMMYDFISDPSSGVITILPQKDSPLLQVLALQMFASFTPMHI